MIGNRVPHGLTLEDVAGSIHKNVSYWAIDESGNPSRKRTENGKAFTVSAVTELSPIDYERLLEGVPMYGGEVHFSKLRNEHPDICIRLMTDLGRENILVVYKTVKKRSAIKKRLNKHIPIDELYIFSILNEMLDVIQQIDHSDTIIVTYDKNTNITEETTTFLWNDRCILVLGVSDAYLLLQMADLCASSIGRAKLPNDTLETEYFDEIRSKSVEISSRLDGCRSTRRSPVTDINSHPKYKNASAKGKFDYGRNKKPLRAIQSTQCPMIAPNGKRLVGCTQHPSFASMHDNRRSKYKTIGTKGEGSA